MHARQLRLACAILALIVFALFSRARAEDSTPAGIGVALQTENGQVLVHLVLPNTPAAVSDAIHVGDRILCVAEENQEAVDLNGLTLPEVVSKIRGTKGTVIRLTVVPAGKSEADSQIVTLQRGDVEALKYFGDGKRLPTGTVAPELRFSGLSDDKTGALSDFAGKIVVVEFWASWCRPCVKMLDELNSSVEEHPDWRDKLVVLAVGVDKERSPAAELAQSKNWKAVTVVWTSPEVLKTYHVGHLPTLYVIDREGQTLSIDENMTVADFLKAAVEGSDK